MGIENTLRRVELLELRLSKVVGDDIEATARTLVRVEDGTLRDTIHASDTTEPGVAIVTAGIPGVVTYAAPNEYGSRSRGEPDAPGKVTSEGTGMTAQPYMRPAARLAAAKIAELVKRVEL